MLADTRRAGYRRPVRTSEGGKPEPFAPRDRLHIRGRGELQLGTGGGFRLHNSRPLDMAHDRSLPRFANEIAPRLEQVHSSLDRADRDRVIRCEGLNRGEMRSQRMPALEDLLSQPHGEPLDGRPWFSQRLASGVSAIGRCGTRVAIPAAAR